MKRFIEFKLNLNLNLKVTHLGGLVLFVPALNGVIHLLPKLRLVVLQPWKRHTPSWKGRVWEMRCRMK